MQKNGKGETDEGGCVVPKTPEDPPFEVDSATGNRLIGLGVAIAAESTEEPEEDDDMKEDDSLENMSLAELKNLADCGNFLCRMALTVLN